MSNSKTAESKEMYLETILQLGKKQPNLHAVDVANAMGFTKPSVSIAMKNLREEEYITIDEESHIHLTEKGRKLADTIYDRHRSLTAIFESLGVSPEISEADACKIEHVISDETFQAIKAHAIRHGILCDQTENAD